MCLENRDAEWCEQLITVSAGLGPLCHLLLHKDKYRDALCWYLGLKWAAQRWVGETLISHELCFGVCW